MLPELPFAFVFNLLNIIVGYPIWIVFEYRIREVLFLKFMIGVDDGLYMIAVFNSVKPCQHIHLEVFYALVFRLLFNVKYWRQIAAYEPHIFQKKIGLVFCRRLCTPEMISSSNKTVFMSLIEVFFEFRVNTSTSFSGFYHNESNRTAVDHACTKFLPIDGSLVSAYVYSVNLISFRIFSIAIKCAPPKTSRRNKEIIKTDDIYKRNKNASQPQVASGNVPLAAGGILTFCQNLIKASHVSMHVKEKKSQGIKVQSFLYSLDSLNFFIYFACSRARVWVVWSQTSVGPQYWIGPG